MRKTLPPGSLLLPKSGKALLVTEIPSSVLFSIKFLRNTGLDVPRIVIPKRLLDIVLLAISGVASSLTSIPAAISLQIFPLASPLLLFLKEIPCPSLATKILFKTLGSAVPVAKTPSRLH